MFNYFLLVILLVGSCCINQFSNHLLLNISNELAVYVLLLVNILVHPQ